jgi:hypothetical protein
MPPTELAPDVRARVRSREPVPSAPAGPARPPTGGAGRAQRFGRTRLPARHHWVLETVLVLVALVVALVLLLG